MNAPASLVDVRGLNLHLRSGSQSLHILKDVDLAIAPGEVVAVVGPSGSGKTSLMMVLGGLEHATGGSVLVAGRDITQMSEDKLAVFRRRTLGILFQSFHLISSMTALENVELALDIAERGLGRKQIREAAMTALHGVGLADRAHHLPAALSGGEQQRVGLARATVTQPRLLLADEPTGSLDQDSGGRVIELMFQLARRQGAAVLLITHDPELAASTDRILAMDYGRLIQTTKVAA